MDFIFHQWRQEEVRGLVWQIVRSQSQIKYDESLYNRLSPFLGEPTSEGYVQTEFSTSFKVPVSFSNISIPEESIVAKLPEAINDLLTQLNKFREGASNHQYLHMEITPFNECDGSHPNRLPHLYLNPKMAFRIYVGAGEDFIKVCLTAKVGIPQPDRY